MDDIEDDENNSKLISSDRKVLPVHLTSNRKGPRSRHGKRQNEADEAQRMTRSKVRQTGKLLDDTDAWAKKKRCRTNTTQSVLAERWIADLRLQKDRRWRDDENYKNMLLLTGNYSSLRLDDNSSADQTLINKAEHKKGQLPVTEVRCSSPAVANGETESEDESNGICGEMKVMWKEHNEERNNMMNRMYKERIKLRLFWEQELLRLEQREKGFTPRMSAVRFLRENEMCNAQILEESTEPLKPMSRNEFIDVAVVPYSTIILHCLKYPHSGVLGILLGSRSGGKVKVSAAVPLSHESTPLAPSLEVALAIIHSTYPNIIGVYFSNQNYKSRSLNPYAIRLCESVSAVCGTNAVLMQVINWNLSPDCENISLEAYTKDGESWRNLRSVNFELICSSKQNLDDISDAEVFFVVPCIAVINLIEECFITNGYIYHYYNNVRKVDMLKFI
ncbi:hypothetical protein DICVIV_11706 [Dictyocaulus viviparus]|uniref:MPN domain-containing protein n=1 Tax=Dictyocaulus viviparus TaxID=29172 RepID=A0A0D8XF41_DICVI|nr:hypothetical protein DICVIV_11706 [Dictyocaulus viviparus]